VISLILDSENEILLFRTVEADEPQCRRCQALSYWGSGGAWNGSVDWVEGGANGVSLQET
jgi:hypothetical protein